VSTVNVIAREVSAKVVFYGPGLAGKTTSLKHVYESIRPAHRGALMSLPSDKDRTLFFDFLPVLKEKVGDYALRLAMYTVPGQVFFRATRKLVLQGADGVIFVADSRPEAEAANRDSLADLKENLADQGVRLEELPLVFQYNKRDLPGVVATEALHAALNLGGAPEFATCATTGAGVLDAMKAMVRLVMRQLQARRIVPESRPELRPQATPLPWPSRLPEPSAASGARPVAGASAVGPVSALAPPLLVDQARVAEAAFAEGDYSTCLRTCIEAVTRGLAFAGAASPSGQAFLLGLDGRDLLELEKRAARGAGTVDDGAFALYALAQTLVRLAQAGLPVAAARLGDER
jgi:mutual gliding-motility protein MglA